MLLRTLARGSYTVAFVEETVDKYINKLSTSKDIYFEEVEILLYKFIMFWLKIEMACKPVANYVYLFHDVSILLLKNLAFIKPHKNRKMSNQISLDNTEHIH